MKKILILTLAIIAFSCTRLPQYDQTLSSDVQVAEKYTADFFATMLEDSTRFYTNYSEGYRQQIVEAQAIVDKINLQHPLNPRLTYLSNDVKNHLLQYDTEHRAYGTLTLRQADAYRRDMLAFWESLGIAVNVKRPTQ